MKTEKNVQVKFHFLNNPSIENTISDTALRELLRAFASVPLVPSGLYYIELSFNTPRGMKAIRKYADYNLYMELKRACARAVMITRLAEP